MANITDAAACLGYPVVDVVAPLTSKQLIPASNRDSARDLVARMNARRSREATAAETARRIAVIVEGILRMNEPMYGSHNISPELAEERSRNILTALDLANEARR